MSAQSNVVLNDGQTTPVARTFSARGPHTSSKDVMKWLDITSGLPIGMPELTIGFFDDKRSPNLRVLTKLSYPVLEVISGSDGGYTPAPRVAFMGLSKTDLVIPRRMALADRKNLLAFQKNLLAHAIMGEYVNDLNPAY
jgi:hypothetical protein